MSFANLSSSAGLRHNYSLYAVPVGWVVSMAPLWWAIGKTERTKKGSYNNAAPLESWSKLRDAVPDETYKRVIKAVAANNNSHVNLPLFASALVIANIAHLPVRTLHLAAGSYIVLRIGYNLAYILIDDHFPRVPDETETQELSAAIWSWARSIMYLAGVGQCLNLFIQSAKRLSAIPW